MILSCFQYHSNCVSLLLFLKAIIKLESPFSLDYRVQVSTTYKEAIAPTVFEENHVDA